MKQLQHKGYVGSVEVSFEDGVIYGKLLHIRDLVTFEADEISAIERAFVDAVEDYLEDCADSGQVPNKPFKGQFNVRVGADLHRDLANSAAAENVSLNEYVAKVLSCHGHVEKNGQIRSPKADVSVVIQGVAEQTLVSDSTPIYINPMSSRESETADRQQYPRFATIKSKKSIRVQ